MVASAAKALREEGGDPGHSLHGWRCEYPDRFGECDCVEETVCSILEAIGPMFEKLLKEQRKQVSKEIENHLRGWADQIGDGEQRELLFDSAYAAYEIGSR